jgi:hypothetical protein
MKKLHRLLSLTRCLAPLLLLPAGSVAEAQSFWPFGFSQGDHRVLLLIQPDGSCVLTNEITEPRKVLERDVAAWERAAKMSENGGSEEEEAPSAPPAQPAPTPLSDADLASKVRKIYEEPADSSGQAAQLNRVAVSSNSVQMITSQSFSSVKALLSENIYSWGPNALMFEKARFELDTNHNLRITFTPAEGAERHTRNLGRMWKAAKSKFEWKLVLPGKILSSGLPNTQGSETWLNLDGAKPESIDAALKAAGAPLTIVAEPSGLKLDEPLDSQKLFMTAWKQQKSEPDLPITEAAPGFLAEPASVTLTTIHYFPEGEKHLKKGSTDSPFGFSPAGTVVSAKLFPPKGREIRTVSGVRVKSAKDDKGRAIPGISGTSSEEESDTEFIDYNGQEPEKSGAARLELRLGLPAPDAKAIDELQAEAVALTVGGWKEMVLTNVQANATNQVDLSEVLPGAKLTIKKVAGKRPQQRVEATLEGPKEVSQIELKIKLSGQGGGQSNMNERQSKTAGGKTTRTVLIQAFEFQPDAPAGNSPPTLLVRYPQDLKRERVQFKLTALDLL